MDKLSNEHEETLSPINLVMLGFTIVVLAALIVDSLCQLPKEVSNLIGIIDTFSCLVFFIEFCIRFYSAKSKLRFMKWGWIDLITCLPNISIFRYGRFVRVLRVIRLIRGLHSVYRVLKLMYEGKAKGNVISLLFLAFVFVTFSSAAILICERHGAGNIKTAEDAVWWSVTTFTTVGYGDKYPVTTEGRIMGMILMVSGVAMFGAISGLAASYLMKPHTQDTPSENQEILAKLDQLQAKIDKLTAEFQKHR